MTSGFSPAETPTPPFPLSSDWSPLFSLVDEVAERQRRDFGRLASDLKADGSLITDCDRWSDATLAAGLAQIFPTDGLLSEEGSTTVPDAPGFWVVDPLDGTTNFSVGLPIWAISMARIDHGRPVAALLDVPPLGQRLLALRGQGVWSNGQPLAPPAPPRHGCRCASLCSRSIGALRRVAEPFPAKTRMLGVASLNLLGVGLGTMAAALEATPRIWDLAAVWLILEELGCRLHPLGSDPFPLQPGADLGAAPYPLLAARDEEQLRRFLPWGLALNPGQEGRETATPAA